MWTAQIRDQTAHSVQSDLDLYCPQKLLVSSSVRKELNNKPLCSPATCVGLNKY